MSYLNHGNSSIFYLLYVVSFDNNPFSPAEGISEGKTACTLLINTLYSLINLRAS